MNLLRRARRLPLAIPPFRSSPKCPPSPALLRSSPATSHLSNAAAFFRRHYSVRPTYDYPGRGANFQRRAPWYQDQRTVTAVVVLTGAGAAAVILGNTETVSYTKRKHLVLVSPAMEKYLGETQFTELRRELRDKILPPLHPESIRVRRIAADVVRAVQRGLQQDHSSSDASYVGHGELGGSPPEYGNASTVVSLREAREVKQSGEKEEELLDDSWVHESRMKNRDKGATTRHLENLNWEVIVVRDKLVNAMCLPGGKIVVFTGLLDHFRTDEEVAVVLGHEVAHAIARHSAEMITRNLWLAVVQLVILQFFYMPDLINAMSALLLRLPFSRRMEMEADHIGLLLVAAAGYDPRIAPKVYEKLGKISGDSELNNYISTHPSSKKRAEMLMQAKVMEEALQLYRESIGGRGTEGFFL